jgi:hypothetical protein
MVECLPQANKTDLSGQALWMKSYDYG